MNKQRHVQSVMRIDMWVAARDVVLNVAAKEQLRGRPEEHLTVTGAAEQARGGR
jgi:hypothetical protein